MSIEGHPYQGLIEAGRLMRPQGPPIPCPSLNVSEIERLAKAGVTVDLDKIVVRSDAPQPYFEERRQLMDPLIHRLRIAFPVGGFSDQRFSFISAAVMADDKVAVMVVTVHGNAQLLEDDAKSFPSDALMAKLHLLVETEKKRSHADTAQAPTANQGPRNANTPSPQRMQRMLGMPYGPTP